LLRGLAFTSVFALATLALAFAIGLVVLYTHFQRTCRVSFSA
jgi:hypothetical protein